MTAWRGACTKHKMLLAYDGEDLLACPSCERDRLAALLRQWQLAIQKYGYTSPLFHKVMDETDKALKGLPQ